MTQYNLYDDDQYHGGARLFAIEVGSDLDRAQAAEPLVRLVGTVQAQSFLDYSPSSSAFQRHSQLEYINTGMVWPNHRAVVVY